MRRKRLGVVYDIGAAGIHDIIRSIADRYDLVFIIPSGSTSAETLKALGETVIVDLRASPGASVSAFRNHAQLDGVVTFSERMQILTAIIAEELGLIGHDADTVARLTNKRLQRKVLGVAGIPIPRDAAILKASDWDTAIAAVGLPAVIKPICGEGSRKTYPIVSDDDKIRLLGVLFDRDQASPLCEGGYTLEQMLIGRKMAPFGDHVSVDCITVNGNTWLYGITGTLPLAPPFREVGRFWPSHLSGPEQNEIFAITRAALAALGVQNSISHTEVKLTPEGPRIIEVNGRLGGFIADLAIRHKGVDIIREAAEVALGDATEGGKQPQVSRSGITYSYSNLAPRDAVKLVGATGYRLLAGTDGFEGYNRFHQNGSALASDDRTDSLDVLRGHAASPADMIRQLREGLSRLNFTFMSSVECSYSGLDLPSARFLSTAYLDPE